MTVQEAYETYRIMPALQLHQLRAAGVAKILGEHLTRSINVRDAVMTCLFHDTGNIIKFDLTVFPQFLEPEGPAYWRGVKDDYIAKYGKSEHDATEAIAREIGLPEPVIALIEGMGFSKVEQILASGGAELQMVEYADQRVAPQGIVSLQERLEEGRARYRARLGEDYGAREHIFDTNAAAVKKLEQHLFEGLNIKPEDITEEKVQPLFEEFRKYEIF